MMSGSPSTLRVLNDRAALDVLVQEESISRAELEQRVNLSKPATAALLARLEDAGLVMKAGRRDVGPGPRAQLWSLRSDVGFAAGVDVTRTGIDIAVADLRGRVVAEEVVLPYEDGDPIAALLDGISRAMATIGRTPDQLSHVSIGTPGAVDPDTGHLRYASELSAWQGIDLLGMLGDRLPAPVTIENDVNLVALNEMTNGVARGIGSFFLLWLSERGVGSSVVVDGALIRGATLGAGEIGFTLVPDLARVGTRSGGRRYGDLLAMDALTELARAHDIDASGPVAALRRGLSSDPTGFPTDLARRVASGLSAVVNILDPELIVLDGDVAESGGEVFRQLIATALTEMVPSEVPIVTARPETSSVRAGAVQAALTHAREVHFRTGSVIPQP